MLLLVTGASGVGKSVTRMAVAPQLAPQVDATELWPLLSPAAGITKVWRQQAVEVAVRRAIELQTNGRHLMLAGDPVAAAEVVAAPSAPDLDGIAFCLLDASPEAQSARLRGRGDDLSLIKDHHGFAEWMRHHATDPTHMTHVLSDHGWDQMHWERLPQLTDRWDTEVIDTSELTREAVATAVLDWSRRVLSGAAPTLRINPD